MEFAQKVIEFIIGVVFVFGGAYISKCALESKNMVESSLFGLLGVGVGLFLLVCAFVGEPGGP